ncbi:hexokinase type 2-like [Amphiura filiformis]|uniref:hexokinase type 2-like n=1 Tax=Amphiura filiformis TaxID=82378 RepID=UPI003B2195BA
MVSSMDANLLRVSQILESLFVSKETLNDVKGRMRKEMVKGLGKSTNADAKVKMFPTYVRSLPSGQERGSYFALDLGGSNFRVLLVELEDGKVNMKSKVYAIAKELMTGTGVQLFDYIADCLREFKAEHCLSDQNLPLGFTFSFKCQQKGLASATLVSWAKGFSAQGVVGEDVSLLLKEACDRKKVLVDSIAVLNDTTGTLMSCAYNDQNAFIGLILGTGTNACYMEKLQNVELWDGDLNDPKEVIINMEWGAFGDNGCLNDVRTEFDVHVDDVSLNKGRELYEKMISGMYLGEIVRLILAKAIENKFAFNGKGSDKLSATWSFETKFISEVESDESEAGDTTRKILEDNLHLKPSARDIKIVKDVCAAVSIRAAKLVSAGLAAVIEQTERKNLTVAIDGSLYKFHPKFHSLMLSNLEQLVPESNVKFMLSEDGSGKGAALVAATCH